MTEKRPQFLFYIIGFLFFILLFSLFNLQIINGEKYFRIAERNYVRIKTIEPVRGEIFDRKFRPIVTNKPSYNLYIVLGKIRNKTKLIDFIEEHFGSERKNIEEIIRKNRFRLYQEILLVRNVNFEKMVEISEKLNYFPSLFFKTGTVRNYAYENNFTGYLGRINEKEFSKLKNEGYTINSIIGKTGLERYYEKNLAGKKGFEILQVDASGKNLNLFKYNPKTPPVNGQNLILTIDNDLQNYLEHIFPSRKRGSIIVTNIATGGILAYISKPDFDPNIFNRSLSEKEWNLIVQNPAHPMLDRNIRGVYPPGSVYKPIMATLGLETGIIDENTKLAECTGGMQVGNRFYKCWLSSGHGKLNVIDALKYSCDVFFYDLSLQFALQDLDDFTKKNMLTVPTGIDLPGERAGFFPTEKWFRKNYGKYISLTGQKVNIAIGQGELLVTPLQICAYYAALGNEGEWIQPHLLMKTVDENGSTKIDYEHLQLPVSPSNLELIKKALYKVVNERYGTGTKAFVRGVTVYGKTGSAENHMGEKTHAWFAGFAEWEKPEIGFVVFLENAGHGGSEAAPIAKKIVEFYDNLREQ